jgi:hypothetical protein
MKESLMSNTGSTATNSRQRYQYERDESKKAEVLIAHQSQNKKWSKINLFTIELYLLEPEQVPQLWKNTGRNGSVARKSSDRIKRDNQNNECPCGTDC